MDDNKLKLRHNNVMKQNSKQTGNPRSIKNSGVVTVTCKGSEIRTSSEFLAAAPKVGKWQSKVFQILRINNIQSKIVCLAESSIMYEGSLKYLQACKISKT